MSLLLSLLAKVAPGLALKAAGWSSGGISRPWLTVCAVLLAGWALTAGVLYIGLTRAEVQRDRALQQAQTAQQAQDRLEADLARQSERVDALQAEAERQQAADDRSARRALAQARAGREALPGGHGPEAMNQWADGLEQLGQSLSW